MKHLDMNRWVAINIILITVILLFRRVYRNKNTEESAVSRTTQHILYQKL